MAELMDKTEAEPAVRSLVATWFTAISDEDRELPTYLAFKNWLTDKGYSHFLDFRSVAGADKEARRWFEEEIGNATR